LFDPEHRDIDCPKCLRQKVYFDREIGCYCMFCGHLLSAEEVLVQTDRLSAGTPPTLCSDKKEKAPIIAIKESRSAETRGRHVEQKSEKHKDEKTP